MSFKKSTIRLKGDDGKMYNLKGYMMFLDIYHVYIELLFGNTKEVLEWNKKYIDKTTHGFVHDYDGTYMIWIKNKTNVSTIVHELYHLVNLISHDKGLSNDRCCEQQAYLMGYLFDEIKKVK